MKRKALIPILLVLGLAVGAFYWVRSRQPDGLVLTGIITTDEVNVSSQIQGLLSHLQVKEGDNVLFETASGVRAFPFETIGRARLVPR